MVLTLFETIVPTPVGEMRLLASRDALCALEFMHRVERLDARRRRWFPPHAIEPGRTDVTERTLHWLDDYFGGGGSAAHAAEWRPPLPADLSLAMYGAPFERRVWEKLVEIPPGETTTYGAIARQLGNPGASRAVGLANGANPIAVIVPCHRVIGSSGSLTGYGGGLDRKRWLLAHEAAWRAAKLF